MLAFLFFIMAGLFGDPDGGLILPGDPTGGFGKTEGDPDGGMFG